MRLIDADALKEKYTMVTKRYSGGIMECPAVLLKSIDSAPTIDAVSVVHGEWIEHKERTIVMNNNFVDFFPTEYECSNCGLRRATYSINSPLSNYCPNCGARMKGADDE